jgi:hypothetical protein
MALYIQGAPEAVEGHRAGPTAMTAALATGASMAALFADMARLDGHAAVDL